MRIVILDGDGALMARLSEGLIAPGRQILCGGVAAMAELWLRRGGTDLLIIGACGGRTADAVLEGFSAALPPVIVMSDGDGAEAARLFARHPAIWAILGRETEMAVLARIATAAMDGGATPVSVPVAESPAAGRDWLLGAGPVGGEVYRDKPVAPPPRPRAARASEPEAMRRGRTEPGPAVRDLITPGPDPGPETRHFAVSRLLPQVAAPPGRAVPMASGAARRLNLG